jgi:prepilin-type N-terminal cleavage/methylation domain-containing protein
MKRLKMQQSRQAGFSILEVMMVVAVMALLFAIALPNYFAYLQRGRSAACHLNRYHLQVEAQNFYLEHNRVFEDLVHYQCPSGGSYYWIVSDPTDPRFPKIGCSIHLAPVEPPAEESMPLLLTHEFDDMASLNPILGAWEVVDGRLVPKGGGERRLAFGEEDWTDYTVLVNAEINSGSGYGVYYRIDGKSNTTGYIFQYDPGYGSGEFLVREVFNGKEQSPIQRTPIPEDFPVYNQSHTVSVKVAGDHHVIQIDGVTVLDFTDDTFDAGMTGLRTWSNSEVSFDDVRVSAAGVE